MKKKLVLIIMMPILFLALLCCLSYAGEKSLTNKGNSLPGKWRPFSDDSSWNKLIASDAKTHVDSDSIIAYMSGEAKNIRFAKSYAVPVWVVNSDGMQFLKIRSSKIFDRWDKDKDGWSDEGIPITEDMWGEGTEDGHISIIDPVKKTAWELSGYKGFMTAENGVRAPRCSTFNIWDLSGKGEGDSSEGERWWARGGRGSGFPLIAGLVRPEEIKEGAIRHALVFTFPKNRRADNGKNIFIPPACRSDGKHTGSHYPIEGMRFQLDPSLTEKDFDALGLNREGKIVARALQKYGMFLGDNGGAMAVQVQLLAPAGDENRKKWDSMFPGFYKSIEKIPTAKFRVVYTGEPIIK
ncbi:MAG: hypothetical protein HQL10_01165 [Nitrospirae bacterium]|nr:hypothetical protein [Nitrospirota bacterium]